MKGKETPTMGDHLYSQANLLRASAISGNETILQHYIAEFEEALNFKDAIGCSLLIYAVLADALKCAALLLQAGIKINGVDKNGRSALHWAASKGSYQCLKFLLLNGADWELKDGEGGTALHMAARHSDPKCLSLLLKTIQQKDVDAQDTDMRTALHWSSCCGHLENVKLLIKHKANPANPDVEGKTPIHWAATSQSSNASECLKVLLERAPSAVNWVDYEGRGALHLAVVDGRESVVRELISLKCCNINLLDNSSHTPLHLAAHFGYCNIVVLLLHKNASIFCADTNLATPLHLAILSTSVETVEALVKKPMDIDQRDANGCSAFMWAAGKNATEIMQCLINHGADIQASDKHGSTALHIAALCGHAETIEFLLENGAAIDAVDEYGRSALSYACEMGHSSAVLALLTKGSSLMHADHDERTALHWAASCGHRDICELLINKFSCQDLPDRRGQTALIYAAFGGYHACMSGMIGLHRDIQHFDNEGFSSLHYAGHQGHYNAVKCLINADANPNLLSKNSLRCTALDLALLNNHRDVALYLLNNRGVSAVDVFNASATKIQAAYRGHRFRMSVTKFPVNNRISKELNRSSSPQDGRSLENSSLPFDGISSRETLCDSVFTGSDLSPGHPDKGEDYISGTTNESLYGSRSLNHQNRNSRLGVNIAAGKAGFRYVKQAQKPIKSILWNRKKFQETYFMDDKTGSSMSLVNFAAAALRGENKSTRVRHHSAALIAEQRTGTTKFLNIFKEAVADSPPNVQILVRTHESKSFSMGHLEVLRSRSPKEDESWIPLGTNYWISNVALTKMAKEEWTTSLFGSHCQRTRIKKPVLTGENGED